MPKKYIKKEKKLINYKGGSFNYNAHKLFVLFEDLSKEILGLHEIRQTTLANILTTLSKQDRVKVSKVTIDKRVFCSYHYTFNFKRVLYQKEPQNYPQFEDAEKRRTNTYWLGRATRISDSMCMGMMAGIEYEPQKKPALKVLCERPPKENKKEDQNSNKNGQSLSAKKSNLIQEYNDLSYTINHNFIPNYNNSVNKKNLLKEGVIYACYEMGVISQLSDDDVNHNKFTTMTGILLADEEAYCLYHIGQGKMSWITHGESTQAIQVGQSISALYPKYMPVWKIPNSIIFIRKMEHIKEVVQGYMKGKAMHEPGTGFDRAHIVPVKKEGVALLRWLAQYPDFTESVANIFLKEKDKYVKNKVNEKVFPFKSVAEGTPCSILADMDIMKCREINRAIEECDYERVTVVCLEWQKQWLKRVLPDSTSFAVLKDTAIETIVQNHLQKKSIRL